MVTSYMQFSYRDSLDEVQNQEIAIVSLTQEKFDRILVKESGQKVLEVGLGEKKLTHRSYILLVRRIVKTAIANKVGRVAVVVTDIIKPETELSLMDGVCLFATQAELANYTFDRYKSEENKKEIFSLEELILVGSFSDAQKEKVQEGKMIGKQTNACRDFANTPGSDLDPTILVQKTQEMISNTPIKMSVLEKEEMEKLQMGGVLGVGEGSVKPAKFIVLEYNGGSSEQPIVLVGKAVTFDSGGLNLKGESGILGMHMDMSGGGAVINTIVLAAKLKLQKNIVALIPAVENMPSGSSYKPGDIVKTMSGITVEVVNTDAEGRLILADALTYAKRYNPKLVIDVATLTGACCVALGERACGIFTKDDRIEKVAREAGEFSGDFVWPLPLWDEYAQEMESSIADIGNLPSSMTRFGGAITAAKFLETFAKDYLWMHIDMAPRMKNTKDHLLDSGSSGSPVQMLIEFLKKY